MAACSSSAALIQGTCNGLSGHGRTATVPPRSSLVAWRDGFANSRSLLVVRKPCRLAEPKAANLTTVCASTEFAEMEAVKFRQDLIVELGKDNSTAEAKNKIADICTTALRSYAESYNGTLTPQLFQNMKAALTEQGLPTTFPLCAAIWWVRAHFNKDWDQWSSARQ